MIVLRASCVSCALKQRAIDLLTVRVNGLTPIIGKSWSWLTLDLQKGIPFFPWREYFRVPSRSCRVLFFWRGDVP